MRVTFLIHSYFTPDAEPYVGTFDFPARAHTHHTERMMRELILETIFERGNAPDSGVEPFPGWAQPSASVGDTIRFRLEGEGTGVIYSYRIAIDGFEELDDLDSSDQARKVQDCFASVDPDFAETLAVHRTYLKVLRARGQAGSTTL